jgi:hypothetical protein
MEEDGSFPGLRQNVKTVTRKKPEDIAGLSKTEKPTGLAGRKKKPCLTSTPGTGPATGLDKSLTSPAIESRTGRNPPELPSEIGSAFASRRCFCCARSFHLRTV